MYMAFVIHEDDEDQVSFYTRNKAGEIYRITEYIQRGDARKLSYFIHKYMFPKKSARILTMQNCKSNSNLKKGTEKKELTKK